MILKTFIISAILLTSSIDFAQNEDIETSGDIIQFVLPITALSSSLFWPKEDKEFLQFAKAMSTSIIITHTLKVVIDKDRPNGATDGHSFPSGHTSSAFTGAAFLNIKYGWKVGIPSYLLASYVAWTRVEVGRHDTWDVIGGAITGIACAYIFKGKKKADIKFSKEKDQILLGLSFKF